MPTISLRTSVAANGSSGNVLAGSPFEFVAKDAIIILAVVNPAGTPGGITADFQIGGESLTVQANIGTANRFPQFNDDVFVKAGAIAGERLFLNYNNTTAGVLVVDTLVDVMPI